VLLKSAVWGKLKQYEIAVNPDRLNAYGITINDVFDALNTNNQNTGGAYIEKGPTVFTSEVKVYRKY
jgi:cobalt-zinc-cadmium resistance protein CzcA